jgi:hypothetical protein
MSQPLNGDTGCTIRCCYKWNPVTAVDTSKKFDKNHEADLGMPVISYNRWKVNTVYRPATDLAVFITTAAGGIG